MRNGILHGLARGRRVLYVSDRLAPNNIGGAELMTQLEADAWVAAGGEAAVFTTFGEGAAPAWDEKLDNGVRVFRPISISRASDSAPGVIGRLSQLRGSWSDKSVAGHLRRAVDEFAPDVVHAHHIPRISYGAVARLDDVPRVLTFHDYRFECARGGLVRPTGHVCLRRCAACVIHRRALRPELARFEAVVAISSFIQRRLHSSVPAETVHLVPNAAAFSTDADERSATAPDSCPRSLHPSDNPRLSVLALGRLEANKAIVDFARHFAAWDVAEWHLTVAGRGSQAAAMQMCAAGTDRIDFVGGVPHDEVTRLMRAADVVVVPSRWHEVLNTVIREAQSLGRVVIATDLGGNADMIEDGVTGLLLAVEPSGEPDWRQLRDLLRAMHADPNRRIELGQAAAAVASTFDVPAHTARIVEVYDVATEVHASRSRKSGVTP
jgi:glycosyltransferase involved in cell wall biosynthesis